MQLDQSPSFRRTIAPWYDSNTACWALIVFMVPVFLFALSGIGTAAVMAPDHIWFPGILAFLSFFLILKVYLRLRQRSD